LLLVGSGVDLDNADQLLEHANGAIVGTSLKRDGIVSNPLDPERVRRMAQAIHAMP
jgi:predicted TIM-barrel enzyme